MSVGSRNNKPKAERHVRIMILCRVCEKRELFKSPLL